MIRYRVRIRFRKEGDLRLISHRDLVRAFERLFRRAALQLSMSEGFHPKARMSFPLALGLGIEGTDEVMELELAQPLPPEELATRLRSQAPPGLAITEIGVLSDGQGKAQVERVTYRFPVPRQRHEQLRAAIEQLMARPSYCIQRPERREAVDLRAGLERLELADDAVHICLRTSRTASVRPREILEVLGLADLENQGYFLTRTAVELDT